MEPFLPDPVGYRSNSQRARVATETWVTKNLYCPACPSPDLEPTPTGHPVADFACPRCGEEYQLKSKRGRLGARITDAAYSEAVRAAERNAFPHLFLMQYAAIPGPVVTLQAVPGRIHHTEALESRKALSSTARRAGWIGYNIVIGHLPQAARVAVITEGYPRPIREVRQDWRKWDFLKVRDASTRMWFNEIPKRVERRAGKSSDWKISMRLRGTSPASSRVIVSSVQRSDSNSRYCGTAASSSFARGVDTGTCRLEGRSRSSAAYG